MIPYVVNHRMQCYCYNFYIDNYTVRQCSSSLHGEISLKVAFGRQGNDFREQSLWPRSLWPVPLLPTRQRCMRILSWLWVNWGSLMPLRRNPLRLGGQLPPWFLVLSRPRAPGHGEMTAGSVRTGVTTPLV